MTEITMTTTMVTHWNNISR